MIETLIIVSLIGLMPFEKLEPLGKKFFGVQDEK